MTNFQPGTIFDRRYRIVRQLGEGGYGAVYEANRVVGNGAVALKILHPHLAANETHQRRFLREAELVEKLNHPNIVRLLDVGRSDDGTLFAAFSLVAGQTAGQLRKQAGGALPEATVVHWMMQLLSGLGAAHQQGVIHRDIKPSNVMVVPSNMGGTVKILDFGVAKVIEGKAHRTALTEAGMALGTPNYLAPEQVRGELVDGRTDLYSVGLMMVRLLSGEMLVKGDSDIEIMVAHLHRDPHVLPPTLQASRLFPILQRTIAKDPQHRFQSAAELQAALVATTMQHHPVIAPPTPAPAPQNPTTASPSKAGPNKGLAVAAVMLACLLVGGTVAAVLALGSPTEQATNRPKKSAQARPTSGAIEERTSDCEPKPNVWVRCPSAAKRSVKDLVAALNTAGYKYEKGSDFSTGQQTNWSAYLSEERVVVSLNIFFHSTAQTTHCVEGAALNPGTDGVSYALSHGGHCVVLAGNAANFNVNDAREMFRALGFKRSPVP